MRGCLTGRPSRARTHAHTHTRTHAPNSLTPHSQTRAHEHDRTVRRRAARLNTHHTRTADARLSRQAHQQSRVLPLEGVTPCVDRGADALCQPYREATRPFCRADTLAQQAARADTGAASGGSQSASPTLPPVAAYRMGAVVQQED